MPWRGTSRPTRRMGGWEATAYRGKPPRRGGAGLSSAQAGGVPRWPLHIRCWQFPKHPHARLACPGGGRRRARRTVVVSSFTTPTRTTAPLRVLHGTAGSLRAAPRHRTGHGTPGYGDAASAVAFASGRRSDADSRLMGMRVSHPMSGRGRGSQRGTGHRCRMGGNRLKGRLPVSAAESTENSGVPREAPSSGIAVARLPRRRGGRKPADAGRRSHPVFAPPLDELLNSLSTAQCPGAATPAERRQG